eukprot:CAMPEP_0204869754 /NCGR_PEP_ID=MMETSP1348-20121228/30702_1 /ASSEMBLY_ACC=CAM_ASM_000700 /TAXON_ID=215587 /ORGANISM="Aplanochytrium stocchinoi, Strain GSBS06" /LENGTH=38 /DNA_ID= /DNA_START= /DNA_END= /DNA_ORIENTATION=
MNVKNNGGETPLDYAQKYGRTSIVEILNEEKELLSLDL